MALAQKLCINIESCNDVVEPSSCSFLFWSPSAYGLIMETAQELLYTVLAVTPPEKIAKQTAADVLILN